MTLRIRTQRLFPAQPDLALDKSRWCVLGGTQQTLAERASRLSKKNENDG
jgi:hypothetical protein